MGLVRFETDDHHSQTVLGTHHIEDVTPHEDDDQHVDIRITDGRVFVVRETMASVGDKLAAHGVFLPLQRSAEPKRDRKPIKVNLPPQAAPEAQPAAEGVVSPTTEAGTES